MSIYREANKKLDLFIQTNLDSYHKLRNYDYGVFRRTNVSQISKYITHRILYEYDILKKLKNIDKKKKFTDEILWRLYWKGYLENYKSIWDEYKIQKGISYNSNDLKNAQNGKTGIKCFNKWLIELRENNYLHNHTRMWFASIWIFTLRLPWQKGAEFFMYHLLDGDAASNTLSWRWIAGLHTNKKPYIATKENINKYTTNRFNNISINIPKQMNKMKNVKHLSNKLPTHINPPKSHILIMFENDLYIFNRLNLFETYSKIYIISNHLDKNSVRFSKNVIDFKTNLIKDINKLLLNSEILNSSDLEKILIDSKFVDVIYPGVGTNLDFINGLSNRKEVILNYIYREDDIKCWKNAYSGFFKFKKTFL